MRTLTRIVLALLIVSAGAAWAASTTDEPMEATPEVSQPTEPSEEMSLEQLLEEGEPIEAGACCYADCLSERIACRSACAIGDSVCLLACEDDFDACSREC